MTEERWIVITNQVSEQAYINLWSRGVDFNKEEYKKVAGVMEKDGAECARHN